MYMQMRKFRVKSGTAEQLCKQAADEFLPIVSKLPGFVDYMIVDNKDGNVMSVSIFQDQAGVEESKRKAVEWHQKFSGQLEGPLEVIEGEVLTDSSGFLKKAEKAA
jgi:hypothetical protein